MNKALIKFIHFFLIFLIFIQGCIQNKNDNKKYYNKDEIDSLLQNHLDCDYAIFEERKNSGEICLNKRTSNTFIKRELNTIVFQKGNSINLNISNGTIILSPGLFYISASAPAYFVISHQLRLRNITDNKTELLGTSESASVSGVQTRSFIEGIIELKKNTSFELQHYYNNSQTNSGFGMYVESGEMEVYSRIFIKSIQNYKP